MTSFMTLLVLLMKASISSEFVFLKGHVLLIMVRWTPLSLENWSALEFQLPAHHNSSGCTMRAKKAILSDSAQALQQRTWTFLWKALHAALILLSSSRSFLCVCASTCNCSRYFRWSKVSQLLFLMKGGGGHACSLPLWNKIMSMKPNMEMKCRIVCTCEIGLEART